MKKNSDPQGLKQVSTLVSKRKKEVVKTNEKELTHTHTHTHTQTQFITKNNNLEYSNDSQFDVVIESDVCRVEDSGTHIIAPCHMHTRSHIHTHTHTDTHTHTHTDIYE
eukprot:GHVR01109601.1.p1 GENE.GHVR01109601.1~~GHVR01109601.1.p1  ORF type:complete len:109 (+),score=67.79 GHVR01109601.1:127-453(+)